MDAHIKIEVVSDCYYKQLRQIKTCRRSIPIPVAESLVNCFIMLKVDHCNALFANQPECVVGRLQLVLDAAARLVYGLCKFDHVAETICDKLHWLHA
jgi:hypothetical protein